jgi:hypothetical protein
MYAMMRNGKSDRLIGMLNEKIPSSGKEKMTLEYPKNPMVHRSTVSPSPSIKRPGRLKPGISPKNVIKKLPMITIGKRSFPAEV